ncbi:MAG: toxin-antitoxin system HicB family antitoxin [Anaerolineae bacterium]|nr:toxin-antitoxin system HicB family antitoxin [Anaerolineae bacterium]
MSELMLQLPESLYAQLESLAQSEGVPLNQYILYSLTRQVASAYTVQVLPPEAVAQQRSDFETFMQSLGRATDAQVEEFLAQREMVEPEPELLPEAVTKLRQKVAEQMAS